MEAPVWWILILMTAVLASAALALSLRGRVAAARFDSSSRQAERPATETRPD
jgi:hypothetical protein